MFCPDEALAKELGGLAAGSLTSNASYMEASEDAGWVVVMVYDGKKRCNEMTILDVKCLAAGPVCVLRM